MKYPYSRSIQSFILIPPETRFWDYARNPGISKVPISLKILDIKLVLRSRLKFSGVTKHQGGQIQINFIGLRAKSKRIVMHSTVFLISRSLYCLKPTIDNFFR